MSSAAAATCLLMEFRVPLSRPRTDWQRDKRKILQARDFPFVSSLPSGPCALIALGGVVVLRSIGLGLALMAFPAAADEGVERDKGRAEMVVMKVTAQSLRTLTGLFAQAAPDQVRTPTVVIGFRG
jgi:hypothetical protein